MGLKKMAKRTWSNVWDIVLSFLIAATLTFFSNLIFPNIQLILFPSFYAVIYIIITKIKTKSQSDLIKESVKNTHCYYGYKYVEKLQGQIVKALKQKNTLPYIKYDLRDLEYTLFMCRKYCLSEEEGAKINIYYKDVGQFKTTIQKSEYSEEEKNQLFNTYEELFKLSKKLEKYFNEEKLKST